MAIAESNGLGAFARDQKTNGWSARSLTRADRGSRRAMVARKDCDEGFVDNEVATQGWIGDGFTH